MDIYQFNVAQGQRFFNHEDLAQLYDWALAADVVVIEGILDQRMNHQSPVHTNTTAVNFGMILGHILAAHVSVDIEIVRAADWKKRMGLWKQDKAASSAMALKYFPHLSEHIHLVKHHDKAEAVLIGVDYMIRNGIYD